jgi:hypothetical protein
MMRKRRSRALRMVGWLAVTGMLGTAILGPAAAPTFANDLHQTPPISWDATGYGDGCDEVELKSGEVLWHFVLTQTESSSGKLTAEFDEAGTITVDSYKNSGSVLHWQVITGHDTLLDASSDVDGGNLNLSHICVGPDESQAPSESTSPTEAPSESVAPTEAPSESVAPTEAPSESVTPSEAPSETPAPSESATPAPSSTPSETPSESPKTAWIAVAKIVDADGDPSTVDDESFPAGWHFNVKVGGGTADPSELVSAQDDFVYAQITLDGDSASVSIEEVLQQAYTLADAVCFTEEAASPDSLSVKATRFASLANAQSDEVGQLDGNVLSFDVAPGTITFCGFFNVPDQESSSPSGGVEAATGTPRLTPPSTDSIGSPVSGSTGETWRLMLIAMAGLLATILVLTPATRPIRKR